MAILFSGFHIVTGLIGNLPGIQQRVIHATLGWMLIFLLVPADAKFKEKRWALFLDLVLAGISLIIGIYVYFSFFNYHERVGMGVPTTDLILGTIAIIFTCELCRRAIGKPFFIMTLGFIAFAFLGPYLPDLVSHKGMNITEMVGAFFLTTSGIYGMITGVSATYIAIFIILAAFIRESGVGDFFMKISLSIFGTVRGGPAKMAVVVSSLFGMITGSSIANVASVGSFTIPLMKRSGYPPYFAGAVEAVASSGAQLMPPIMGGSVFIMIEILGISYWTVAKASFLIAFLFYIGLYSMIDFEAVKRNLKGLPRKDLPNFKDTLIREGHLLLPIIFLVILLAVYEVSPFYAASLTILSIPFVGFIRRSSRMSLSKIVHALREGANGALIIVGVVCAASFIAGITERTALGFNISTVLIQISGGSLFLLLLYTSIASLILGMGLPVMICYILLAVLVAPGLVKMGVDPLAAHLFIFYYGILANITPPDAPDAYVAASIANADMMRTAWEACRIGLVLYLLPWFLVYNPALMIRGNLLTIVWTFGTGAIGTYMLACFLQGMMFKNWVLSWPERILSLVSALFLIKPGIYSDIIGAVILMGIAIFRYSLEKKRRLEEGMEPVTYQPPNS